MKLSEQLYATLQARGVDVLLDDRDERAGVKFADLELVGIPHRVVISDKNIHTDPAQTLYEYVNRRDGEKQLLTLAQLLEKLV